MEDFRLPKELTDLEQQLAARALPEPSPELRGRVITAIRQKTVEGPALGVTGAWRFAAALAAALLLMLNLSMSVANRAERDGWRRPQQQKQDTAAAARKLAQIVPELSEQEAFRTVLLLQNDPPLILAPCPRAPSD
jgi:hypothetical protein